MELLVSLGSTIWNPVIPFLVVLTILVFVHEFGHYIVARWNGVRVDVFSIGFGKELLGYTDSGGTRWKFSLIPLGGYVKMHGDADASSSTIDEKAAFDPDSYPAKSVLQRMSIIVAGPLANILFATVALAFLFAVVGRPFTPAVVGNVNVDSAAALAGLQTYDRIIAVDGSEIESFEQLRTIERDSAGVELLLKIDRNGDILEIPITPEMVTREDRVLDQTFKIGDMGVGPPLTRADVASVRDDSAAQAAGLAAGDRIVAVNKEPLLSFEALQDIVSTSPDVELLFTIDRGGDRTDLPITPQERIVVTAEQGGAAEETGLTPGDVIVAVNKEPLLGLENLQAIVGADPDVELLLTVDRGGNKIDLPITPLQLIEITDENSGQIRSIGRIGVERPLPPLKRVNPIAALGDGLIETYRLTSLILGSVWQLITGKGSTDDLGGPIRIAQITGEITKVGLFPAVMFTVMLSINLGLINLFPIPVLDGGHLVMLFIELVRGRPLNERSQEIAFRFGLALVLSLLVFVTWQDLMRFDLGFVDYIRSLVS